MHLEPAIRNDLIELIAANFKTDEVNELGRLVLGCFDSNEAAGKRHHVSLSPRKSAGLLVEKCQSGETLASLIKLVVEMDNAVVHGRPVQVDGLEEFLGKFVRTGIQYDFKTRRVVKSCRDPQDLPNWGCLKDGREYDITVVSLKIVGNSAKVRKLGTRRMEKLYFMLWSFLKEKLASVDGRTWSWAGDGGIIALRLGIDSGRVKFCIETGTIVSDVINYAAHLEKSSTLPGTVSISRAVYDALPPRVASIFRFGGIFEEKDFFRTIRRLDTLLYEEPPDSEERLA